MYTVKIIDNWATNDDYAYLYGYGYTTIAEAEDAIAFFKREDIKNGEENRWTYIIIKEG